MIRQCLSRASAAVVLASSVLALATPAIAEDDPPPAAIDYLSFARGAIPLSVSGATASLGATMEKAIKAIDGDPSGYSLALKSVPADADTVFLYELPALTTFERFAVPNVLETPSPSQTFTQRVEVSGSAIGPAEGFSLLAAGDLQTHAARGAVTELVIAERKPVRWVRLRLVGGIDIQRELSFFEFSEIIGNGTQEATPLASHFNGTWAARGIQVGLRQADAAVAGCYDARGVLEGTVSGNVLRATGKDTGTGVPSLFVLTVDGNGALRGLRSTNGAPFALYNAEAAAPSALKCSLPGEPVLGCDSVIHGINFNLDSAAIRPDSGPVLAMLYAGLRSDASARIRIEGHTSSEGSEQYNQALSQRRAQAVVDDLVQRGIAATRLQASGAGESRPIATNADESGRSLNRRVEVHCGEPAS